MYITPNCIIFAVFLSFVIFGGTLNMVIAFGTIAAFLIIQVPIKDLTDFFIKYDDALNSIKRI